MRSSTRRSWSLLASLAAAGVIAWGWYAASSAPSIEPLRAPPVAAAAPGPVDEAPVELERGAREPASVVNATITRSPPLAQAPRARPPAPTGEEIAAWELEVAGKSAADLRELATEIEGKLNSAASIALRARQETGAYDEVVGHGTKHKLTKDEKAAIGVELACYQFPGKLEPAGEQRKTVLPPDEFPELYAMKRHATWLRARANELRQPK